MGFSTGNRFSTYVYEPSSILSTSRKNNQSPFPDSSTKHKDDYLLPIVDHPMIPDQSYTEQFVWRLLKDQGLAEASLLEELERQRQEGKLDVS